MDESEYCNRVSIMVDDIEALDTPAALRHQFADTMDEVFRQLMAKVKMKQFIHL